MAAARFDGTIKLHESNRIRDALTAFLRPFFNQFFGEENQSAHLHPFGDDVADDLPPFAVRIHFPEQNSPADARQSDEDEQRVPPQKIQERIEQMSFHAAALGGMEFHQIFRAENDDH